LSRTGQCCQPHVFLVPSALQATRVRQCSRMHSDHERIKDDPEGGSPVAKILVDGAAVGPPDSRGSLVLGPYDLVVDGWGTSAIFAAVGGLVVVLGGGSGWVRAAPSTDPAASSAQGLRTCVDRWNQDNMVNWGGDVGQDFNPRA
jgi:hypothetical protein